MEYTFTLKFKLLVLGIIVFLATFVFAMVINTYITRSKAVASALPVKITDNSGTISGTKEVSITLASSDKISGFDLTFATTGNVRVQDSKTPSILGNVAATTPGFFTELTPKSATRIAYGIIKDDASLPAGVMIPIMLTCDGVGTGTFTVTASASKVVGPGGIDYTLDPIENGTYTCASTGTSPTTTPTGPRAHFSPDSAKMDVGSQSSTTFLIDGLATGQQISGFDVKMQVADGVDLVGFSSPASIPPTAVPAVPAVPGTNTMPSARTVPFDQTSKLDSTGCTSVIKSWDAATRIARVSQLCTGSTLLSSVSVPITLKGIKSATGKITITDLDVVGPQATNGYTINKEGFSFQVGAGSGDGGTGGGGTSGNMHLILTLRLQGIQAKPRQAGALQFKVGVVNSSMESPIMQNASFTPDDKGLYHGNVGITAPTGAGFCILVKGPFHLQKKICESSPTETFPGTYSGEKGKITLNNGDNTFDFSKVYMMSCDLPAQDGICNSYDMTFLRENLGKTDAAALSTGDINQDGILNAQDYALAIASLSIKVDDH